MYPTLYGMLIIIVGGYLYFKPASHTLAFVCICTVFPAAAAVYLPALGGSTIPPAFFALAVLGLRLTRRDVAASVGPELGAVKNAWLIVFCVYCAATAFVLPRLFAGRINLIPMGTAGSGFVPLHVTAQNITQAVYVLGTGFIGVAATIVATRTDSVAVVVKAFVVVTWIHVVTGVIDLLAAAAHVEGLFDIVRNGAYAQLDQGVGGFHRIAAMCSEASVYAALGVAFACFNGELWLRRISPRATGPAALAMLVLLGLSTSSTAYLAVGVYAIVLILRTLLIPGSMSLDRAIVLIAIATAALFSALAIMLLKPGVAADFGNTIAEMTIKKGQSASGLERGRWAKQGLDAMKATNGLGVGIGSFRSSSVFTAILGSVGPAGLVVFLGYCLQVAKLTRRTTYVAGVDARTGAGAAAGWTALIVLVPAAFISATADPGLIFALFAGLSLGWRSGKVATSAAPRPMMRPTPMAAWQGSAQR